jgi:gliding motility-associated-like protein
MIKKITCLTFTFLFKIFLGFSQVPGTWTVTPGSYQYAMSITAKANAACVDLADTNNYIAAFVGGQCRGVVKTKTTAGASKLGLILVYSNVVSGEKVNFKIYNNSTNAILNVIDSIIFVNGNSMGGLATPVVMYTDHRPTNIFLTSQSVSENKPLLTSFSPLSATDPDTGSIFSYSLNAGVNNNNDFSISGNQLQTNFPFDYETDSSYVIQVTVNDGYGCTFSNTFSISIINANDTPSAIIFTPKPVSDGQGAGSVMGKFSTVDQDLGQAHTYSLVPGVGSVDNAKFYVQHDSLFNVSAIYWPTQSVYHFRARTTDSGGLLKEDTFAIYVNNANHAPTNVAISIDTVIETKSIGYLIATLTSTDIDAGDLHTYSLTGGVGSTDNAKVSITGNNLYTNALLDYESQDTLHIRITTTDSSGATFVKSFIIKVINDTPSVIVFTPKPVSDGQGVGSLMGKFSTIDPGNIHTYTLVSGVGSIDNVQFYIHHDSLFNVNPIYWPTQSVYHFRARTTDSGGLLKEDTFSIHVIDLNHAPTNVAISIDTVIETKPIGYLIATLSSTDIDAGDTHTYSLTSGAGSADNSKVSITGNNLYTNALLDYESQDTLHIRITTTDSTGATFAKSFIVRVVNDTPSAIIFTPKIVSDGEVAGSLMGKFTTVDPGNIHTYTLVSGVGSTDNNKLYIQHDSLFNVSPIYWPTQSVYYFRARTTDSGGLLKEDTFSIHVADLNHPPTNVAISIDTIGENRPIGTLIATLSSTDVDLGDTHTYSLTSGAGSADNAKVSITGSNLLTNVMLDYEVQDTLHIRLTTIDSTGTSFSKAFVLTVINNNDTATSIVLSADSIYEEQAIGTLIGSFTSVDEDVVDSHSYSLVTGVGSTDNARFTISGTQLVSAQTYTFTHQTYSIRVRTTDLGGAFYDKNFNIRVLNVNDTPTDIIVDTLFVDQDNEPNAYISKIYAVDTDSSDTHTFALVAGAGSDNNDQFSVSENNLSIITKTNYVVKNSYNFRLKTSDNGGLSFEKSFVLSVIDAANKNIPLPSTNYISPNGDGKNDYWVIENVEIYTNFALQIFDQFGQTIYSVPGSYNNQFDGTYKGTPLPTGNYYYVFKNDKKIFKGNITIVN